MLELGTGPAAEKPTLVKDTPPLECVPDLSEPSACECKFAG